MRAAPEDRPDLPPRGNVINLRKIHPFLVGADAHIGPKGSIFAPFGTMGWPAIGGFRCTKRSLPWAAGRCGHRPLRSNSQVDGIALRGRGTARRGSFLSPGRHLTKSNKRAILWLKNRYSEGDRSGQRDRRHRQLWKIRFAARRTARRGSFLTALGGSFLS